MELQYHLNDFLSFSLLISHWYLFYDRVVINHFSRAN